MLTKEKVNEFIAAYRALCVRYGMTIVSSVDFLGDCMCGCEFEIETFSEEHIEELKGAYIHRELLE